MEQDVDSGYRAVCTTCLSSDRNLFQINSLDSLYQNMFRLLMYDFAADRFGDTLEMEQLACWECVALLKKSAHFKRQLHAAQEHLRVLALSRNQDAMDHTYMSQSLSSLEMSTKTEYDKIYFDYTAQPEWTTEYIVSTDISDVKNEQYDIVQAVRDNINLDIDEHMLEVPDLVLAGPDSVGTVTHVVGVVGGSLVPQDVKGELTEITSETQLVQPLSTATEAKERKLTYTTEYMSLADMNDSREEMKEKVQYASSVYKCELCIIGFYTQQQVEAHFLQAHRAKRGHTACKTCYMYIEDSKLSEHTDSHFLRHSCKLCGHVEYSGKLARLHAGAHLARPPHSGVVKIGDAGASAGSKGQKRRGPAPKPGDLRKLLSKTTIEGYQCLECDMFFTNSRARKNHVARCHREGLQCDHCKKRFVNRTTLATHMRLHEGPLPREECPICHKMVRCIQIKYHIQRHQNKGRFECVECNKVFSHAATYQAHLKYSRAHATEQIFKYPCPMCNKGYPTKDQMQDHFNYQHLGKTQHKCPVCDKPIASKANVEKHMMRVHGEKKEKPRNHTCQQCGKAFTDKKALTQHAVIHSGDRPLRCDACHQTFKQKASLYTHRKRVHKLFPPKRQVEFMDSKPDG